MALLKDIMAKEYPEPRWAVPSILPEGLTILAGKPKTGKSFLVLNLAVAIGAGGLALGSKQVEQGGVLYITLEDPYRRIKERTEALLGGDDVPDNVDVYNEWKPLNGEGYQELDTYLLLHPDTRLVIVDTLEKAMPRKSAKNTNSYGDDYAAISSLKKLADKHTVSILIVHHLRKADAIDPQDMISGTTGLTGAADATMVLQRARDEHSATLSITGRDVEERTLSLTRNPDTGRWTLEGDAVEHMTPERRQVITLLSNGPLHYKKIAESLGKVEGTVKTILRRMFGDGLVSIQGNGVYAKAGYRPNAGESSGSTSAGGEQQNATHSASQAVKQPALLTQVVSNNDETTETTVTGETTETRETSAPVPPSFTQPQPTETTQTLKQPVPEPSGFPGFTSFTLPQLLQEGYGLTLEQAARWLDTTVDDLPNTPNLPTRLKQKLKAELERQARAKGLGSEGDLAQRMYGMSMKDHKGIRDYPAAFAFVENYEPPKKAA